jgi:hypothetical protein
MFVFAAEIPLDSSKTVASVTFRRIPTGSRQHHRHVRIAGPIS